MLFCKIFETLFFSKEVRILISCQILLLLLLRQWTISSFSSSFLPQQLPWFFTSWGPKLRVQFSPVAQYRKKSTGSSGSNRSDNNSNKNHNNASSSLLFDVTPLYWYNGTTTSSSSSIKSDSTSTFHVKQ